LEPVPRRSKRPAVTPALALRSGQEAASRPYHDTTEPNPHTAQPCVQRAGRPRQLPADFAARMTACSPGSTSKALATEAALIRISGRPPSGSTPRRGGSRICCPILVRPPPRATCKGGLRGDDPARRHATTQDCTVLPLGRQRPRRCTSSSGGGEGRQYSLTLPATSRLSPPAVASLSPLSRASRARLKRGGARSVPPATPKLCENLPLCHERRHLRRWRATGTDCGTREATPMAKSPSNPADGGARCDGPFPYFTHSALLSGVGRWRRIRPGARDRRRGKRRRSAPFHRPCLFTARRWAGARSAVGANSHN